VVSAASTDRPVFHRQRPYRCRAAELRRLRQAALPQRHRRRHRQITSQTTRGFTGQEELADVGLVHLNGRIYDPLVGRMMSADPYVPDPMNGQAWNRHSYVVNNPLAFTDPNGYCFLGLCGVVSAIGSFLTDAFHAVQTQLQRAPIIGNIIEIAAAAICGASFGCAVLTAELRGHLTHYPFLTPCLAAALG
jgi:RHS repeat-associated protein